jgi:adenylate cyclase
VVDVVEAHGGWVNRFEGDGALCVFGAPAQQPDAAGKALAAGRDVQKRLRRELPQVEVGVGISAGQAVAGNVGAERRLEYTLIGDPIDEVARVCELAKRRPDRVLASGAILVRASSEEAARWELGEETILRGRTEPTRLARPGRGRAHRPRGARAASRWNYGLDRTGPTNGACPAAERHPPATSAIPCSCASTGAIRSAPPSAARTSTAVAC